jgi:hypothetical protein
MAGVFENALLRRFRATVTDSVKMSSNRASVPEAATQPGRVDIQRRDKRCLFPLSRICHPEIGKELRPILGVPTDGSLKQNSPTILVLSATSFAYVTTFTV